MSPTSLANHRQSVSLKRKRAFVQPVPVHRRLAAAYTRRSRRTRIVFVCTVILCTWLFIKRVTRVISGFATADRLRPDSSSSTLEAPVNFVNAQVASLRAHVTFQDGSIQPVYVSQGNATLPLWRTDVERVDVPLGGVLTLSNDGFGKELQLKANEQCQGTRCLGFERALLSMDVSEGLRLMARSEPKSELQMQIPALERWTANSVTLVTQFSVSRLRRFERMLAAWDGPMSVTVYLTDEGDADLLDKHLDAAAKHRWRHVALTVVKPDYSVEESALTKRLRYPINRLRNIALSLAPTSFVIVVDADFVPSPNMHSIVQRRGVPIITETARHRQARSPTLLRTAVVIPAFALLPTHSGPFPQTPAELALAMYADPPRAALTDANAGHGPSLPSLMFQYSPFASPALTSLTRPSWSYSICFEPQWEPYYLLHRASHPLYDERFTDQGGDKQSHALLLNALGFEFRALRDVWFAHPPKKALVARQGLDKRSDETEARVEVEQAQDGDDVIDERWPSARLVDGSTHDDAGDHFNLQAQKDEQRFRYFQDFVPEMQARWGANFRWPRGCDARDLARSRSFGRARSHTAFGL